MARMVTKDSVFGKGNSYSFRSAIQFGQIERVSKFIEERSTTIDLGGLLHYALYFDKIEIVRLLITKFKCSVDCRNKLGETPLHFACRKGDCDVVRMLVSEYKADLLARDNDSNTPLSKAVTSGQDEVVSCLIEEFKCNPNVKGFKGQSLLQQAYDSRNENLAKRLLSDYHVDPLTVDDNGDTILHMVASNGSVEMLNLLIVKYSCRVDSRNNCNETPLHFACQKGNIAAVRVLISQHKADVNAQDSQENVPLFLAAISGHTDVVKCLIDEFNCPVVLDKGINILHFACIAVSVDQAEMLIADYNLDPTSVDNNGVSILHYAAMFCDQEMLNFLITKYKCPVDCRNSIDETPLHCACQKGNIKAVRVLISKHNADLNAHCMGKSTPLNEAALNGHTNVVECLINEFGCSFNVKDDRNRTILHSACRKGHTDLVETLLSRYSLDPLSIDIDRETPIHLAAQYGHQEVVNLLITKYKCPVESSNRYKQTLLHIACIKGHYDLVKMLISEHKADMNTRDDYYERTPFHLAVLFGHTEIVKYLIDEYKCTADIKGSEGTEILHEACKFGYVELAELMVEHYNLDPLSIDEDGNTPLHTAASNGEKKAANLLLSKYNSPVDCRNKANQTPLHHACHKGDLGTIKMLVSEYKADLYAKDKNENTPTMAAALERETEVVKSMIDEFGYDPNIKGYDGRTLLHQACISGSADHVEALITGCNLDPGAVDGSGNTLLHAAAMGKGSRVINLLITEYNFLVDCRNNRGQTPLHIACCNNIRGTKRLVSEHKADLNARDKQNNTPLHLAAMSGFTNIIKFLIEKCECNAQIKGFEGRTILHMVCSEVEYASLAERLITNYDLDPMAVDDNGNTPLHLATLKDNEEMVNILITKYKCPVDCKNKNNESPLDLALENDHQNIISLMKKNLLPMIPREGYICAAQTSICIVQIPSDKPISVVVDSVDDETLHPKLHTKEFLLTPVVRISSDTNVFSPDKQAVVEIFKTTELRDSENNPIPMFSNTHPLQPPRWRDLNPDDFEVLQDRIVFNTTHFSLFTVIARLPTPTSSITVTRNKEDQKPVELTISEVSNVKVVIPPSSIKSESAETEVKIIANFDHPSLCDESVDATACITLEPHGLEFKERIPIRIPIPDYAQITKMYSNAKLQFLHSNDPLDSESANWMVIPEGEYEIVKEDGEHIAIIYSTHFSNRKAVWLNIPKKIKKAIQGPIHEFRKCIAKRFLKSFSGRCQVFMSSETVIGNLLNFSIAALLHPLQECHEIPKNYDYMLYDSEKTPMTVKGSSLKLTVELAEYCSSKESTIFCEEVQLSGDFSARADFNIALDSSNPFVDGAVLGKLSIEHGEAKAHKMNLIKPKKAPIVKHIASSSAHKSNPESEGQKSTAEEPEVIVYVPSLDSTAVLKPKDIFSVQTHLWPARHKWRRIGMAVEIDPTTLEVIQMDNRRTDDCFTEVLTKWLRSNKPSPCWKNLTTALQSVEIKVFLDSTAKESVTQSESPVHVHKKKSPVPSPRKRAPVPLPRKKAPIPAPRKKPPLPPKKKSLSTKQAIAAAVCQLNTSLNQWESNVVTEMAKTIANCTEQMAVHVRDDHQDAEIIQDDFATLAGSIVSESEKLITLGDEVAEACTEETLKKALQQENLPKIEPISKQFKLLMRVMEPSHAVHGDAILVDNAENLLSVVKKVVEDIQVATIEIKDHSVRERLGLKWVKRNVHTVKKFGPVFIPKK